ncbi:hypothetical protein, partial [Escherichia coli]|uniref:hypothetical protein n=1 Tax=Escherichia coli TaxID=562 RepID=UPI001E546C22
AHIVLIERLHTSFPRLPFEQALPGACAGDPGSPARFGRTARRIYPLQSAVSFSHLRIVTAARR